MAIDFSLLESDSEKVDYINNLLNQINSQNYTKETLDEAIINYPSASAYLINTLEVIELSNNTQKIDYDIEYAEKFELSKSILNEGVVTASKKASKEEIVNKLIIDNKEWYKDWQTKLAFAERQEGFYRRLNDMWKKNGDMLITLCSNWRQDQRSNAIQSRVQSAITSLENDETSNPFLRKPLLKRGLA